MENIASIFSNYSGSFPDFVAIDASGPGEIDGTEIISKLINNWMWGWSQRLLDMVGLTPDGVTESASASQIVEAIQLILGPPGTICEWNLNVDPATIGARFLLLNGQGILRANYSDLDINTWVGSGLNATASAWFRADDAAGTIRNSAGVYLILPESRGYTVRGLDVAASVDPDGASRDIGHLQLDAFQGHWHNVADSLYGSINPGGYDANSLQAGQFGSSLIVTNFDAKAPQSDGVNGSPRLSSETRMTNRATQFAVRY